MERIYVFSMIKYTSSVKEIGRSQLKAALMLCFRVNVYRFCLVLSSAPRTDSYPFNPSTTRAPVALTSHPIPVDSLPSPEQGLL